MEAECEVNVEGLLKENELLRDELRRLSERMNERATLGYQLKCWAVRQWQDINRNSWLVAITIVLLMMMLALGRITGTAIQSLHELQNIHDSIDEIYEKVLPGVPRG